MASVRRWRGGDVDDLALFAADGDQGQAQRVLEKMLGEVSIPSPGARAGAPFKRLHLLAGMTSAGKPVDQAIGALQPKPFFRTAQRLRARFRAGRSPAPPRSHREQAEIDAKTMGLPAEAIWRSCGDRARRAASRAK